jgi:hypothetical protein
MKTPFHMKREKQMIVVNNREKMKEKLMKQGEGSKSMNVKMRVPTVIGLVTMLVQKTIKEIIRAFAFAGRAVRIPIPVVKASAIDKIPK